MKARAFEKAVWAIERIRIVIHAPNGTDFDEYNYKKRAASSLSITEFGKIRIEPRLHDATHVVIQGSGEIAHGKASIQTVRGSYSE